MATQIAHDMVCRIGSTVSQSSVCLYNQKGLVDGLGQPIALSEAGQILQSALEKAEYVIHSSKRPWCQKSLALVSIGHGRDVAEFHADRRMVVCCQELCEEVGAAGAGGWGSEGFRATSHCVVKDGQHLKRAFALHRKKVSC